MSRRASSSSSSSSSSSGGVQGKKGSGGIEAVCQTTQASLRELAEMTKKCEGMPPAVVNRWKGILFYFLLPLPVFPFPSFDEFSA